MKEKDYNDESGIDLDNLDLSEFEEVDEPISQGSDNKKKRFFNTKKKKFKYPFIKWIILGIIIILLIIGGIFFFKNKSSNTPTNTQTTESTQTLDSTSKSSEDSGEKLFKQSIAGAIAAQAEKPKISENWKSATLEFSSNNDAEAFKSKLNEINETRISYYENVPDDSNNLNKVVIGSLNNMKEYLQKAYNSSNADEAITIYNEWNTSDRDYDDDYVNTLEKLLKENKISYSKKENKDSGTTTIYY